MADAPEDYLTDVIAAKAVDHIRRFSAEGRPFFLYVATFAPHSPYNPAPRHKGMFDDAQLPQPPSFNEDDVSDKPGFIQELARLNEDQIAEITTHHRQRLECLQAVDELVATLVDTLEDTGELERTYLVYASDNGFHLGAAPDARGQGHGLRGGHPRAARDPRAGHPERPEDRRHGAQHRSRPDLRRLGRHRSRPLSWTAAR